MFQFFTAFFILNTLMLISMYLSSMILMHTDMTNSQITKLGEHGWLVSYGAFLYHMVASVFTLGKED